MGAATDPGGVPVMMTDAVAKQLGNEAGAGEAADPGVGDRPHQRNAYG